MIQHCIEVLPRHNAEQMCYSIRSSSLVYVLLNIFLSNSLLIAINVMFLGMVVRELSLNSEV